MVHFSNQQVITSIQNGDEDILFYLTKKYYQTARRWLRRHGISDAETPSVFSIAMVRVCREIQQNNISPNVDFEQFFFNSLRENKNQVNNNGEFIDTGSSNERSIVASCYTILDESSRKILSARYIEKLSFEQIAIRHNFSNPVIAQFEFNKAFSQLEKITKARLNLGSD